jgi:putative Mg2+ transporter-C (MgtC) family protein
MHELDIVWRLGLALISSSAIGIERETLVRRDTVRALTTAAGVWVTVAVGTASRGDLPLVALTATVIYFVVAYGYPPLVALLPRSRQAPSELRLVYLDGRGILREALSQWARRGFAIPDDVNEMASY